VQPLCHTEPDVPIIRGPTMVLLNIYDLGKAQGIQVLNTVLSALDTGAFHCGVEVHGREFSYEGGKNPGSGIFSCAPKFCSGHSFHQSILMGEIMLTADEVYNLVQLLEIHWPATGYHMLKRNCCHFCEHFCLCLGVGPVPSKIKSLARIVERVDAGRRTMEATMAKQAERCTGCCKTSSAGHSSACCSLTRHSRSTGRLRAVRGSPGRAPRSPKMVKDEYTATCATPLVAAICPDCSSGPRPRNSKNALRQDVHIVDLSLPEEASYMYGYSDDDENQIIDLDPGEVDCETANPRTLVASADDSRPPFVGW